MPLTLPRALAAVGMLLLATSALAQPQEGPPPAVGVTAATRRAVTETNEFIGRIEAIDRVEIMPRVTAFLDKREFTEGTEIRQGDLLFRLERGPFEAQLQQAAAAVAEADAQLQNANVTLSRAQALLNTVAGQRSNVDNAVAAQRSAQAQLLSAQAQQRQAQINLNYTEIRSPIDGRIGRAMITEGNVVSPSSGTLVAIVSQDPMYVLFSVPVRTLLELRARYAGRGGFDAIAVRVRLSDGSLYEHPGKLDFIDIDVGQDTDSITLRARMPNPVLSGGLRDLTAGQLVSVVVEAIEPSQLLTVPRAAVLTDQRGDFVYIVGAENRAERRGIRLGGQSTPELAVIQDGLKDGEQVIVDGLQRVRAGSPVSPAPVAQPAAQGG